ncbi:MAG: hypothetical protein KF819_27575 [Labilithrix sp.]|nr:hypothetical protein [Labilithrix sp.]
MRLASSLLVIVLAACGRDVEAPAPPPPDAPYVPPPETCASPSLDAPSTFVSCSSGGGIFGAWTLDAEGLPAYDYGLDQNADERARWDNTEGQDRRHHWASFGNGRVTAMASNDGWIEVSTQDRGVTILDKVDESAGAFGGGFSFLDDGEATWTTAYKWRPRGSQTTRRFGMGYAASTMLHREVLTSRRTFAPADDATFVIDEVTIENRAGVARSLRHYEYWDVRRRPIEVDWLVSGATFEIAPGRAAATRDGRNGMFDESVTWDGRVLGLRRAHAAGTAAPSREAPSNTDFYPGDPFLASLGDDVSDVYTDDARFFGEGGPSGPRAVVERLPGEIGALDAAARSGLGQPRSFVMRSDLVLQPGEKKTLRFAYGYAPMGATWPELHDRRVDVREHLLSFATERDPFLHRELAWHASQIEASVGHRDYWGRRVVPQGSAYLYLHGADGALRDTALFALPLVYTHPSLAKEQLSLAMGLAFAADSRFSYSFQGHGQLDDALGLHAHPSDLDLFFLLAMNEYLGATGDLTFLDERISYYPRAPENEASVLDHVRRAILHLLDDVGFGEHGLIKIGSGDWSDGVVVGSPDRALAMEKGESVPNSQMALAVLPQAATLIEARDPALAKRVRDLLPGLATAVDATWAGAFYGRAYFGDGVLHGTSAVDLEAQVWPLIGASPRASDLSATVARELDDPSPVGAPLTRGAQVWPAVSQLLTWGYTRIDDELAFRHLAKSSLVARARAHPDVWFHIWSGPDGANAGDGKTWASPVTPMTDFPTMNNNVHAMALLGALRVAGLEATPTGLSIFPHVPDDKLGLRSALVDLDLRPDRMRVVWRAAVGVPRTLAITAPRGKTIAAIRVDGEPRPIAPSFSVTAKTPEGVAIDVDLQ